MKLGRRLSIVAAAFAVTSCQSPAPEGGPATAVIPTASAACTQATPNSGETGAVVAAARSFAATLTPAQRAEVQKPLELQYAIRWSNYPHALIRRNGIAYGDMNPAQTEAANALIRTAAGACGAALFANNRGADVIGARALPNNINPGHHFISFNGEPSATQPWMLMIGGHHLAYNFVFNGREPGATPLFAGSDPARYTDEAGVTREPLEYQSRAMADLARAVSVHAEARLPGVYTDLVRSVIPFGLTPDRFGQRAPTPGEVAPLAGPPAGGPPGGGRPPGGGPPGGMAGRGNDFNYPLTYPTGQAERGVSYSRLAPAQQALVRRAIAAYAGLSGQRISAPLLELYSRPEQLNQTFVGVSGDPNLVEPNAYVRIDGPRVWIEMSVQPSLINRSVTHYHSVWRDKSSDYGGQFKNG